MLELAPILPRLDPPRLDPHAGAGPQPPPALVLFCFLLLFLNYESGKIPNNMKITHDSLKIALGYKKTPLCPVVANLGCHFDMARKSLS